MEGRVYTAAAAVYVTAGDVEAVLGLLAKLREGGGEGLSPGLYSAALSVCRRTGRTETSRSIRGGRRRFERGETPSGCE